MNAMQPSNDVIPNIMTYNCIINACAFSYYNQEDKRDALNIVMHTPRNTHSPRSLKL